MAGEDILFGHEGGLATVLLNRPHALNAFTLEMYRRFDPMLRAWAGDPGVSAVLIRGAGERAFCAGGDVRAIYEAGRGISGDRSLTSVFFREEYELIRRIHRYPKPYVAIVDGITMGGGAGVSVNGAFRVATERTMLAMPETGIGLFPDVGATRFLNLCPGHIGRYLGLTGARAAPAGAPSGAFATHFVPGAPLGELAVALADSDRIDKALAGFAADPGPPPIAKLQPAIDRCFAVGTVEEILDALEREAAGGGPDAEWAGKTRSGLLTKSPTSLKITLRQLITGRDYEIKDALALEYRLTQHVMAGHDFFEGGRAVLVDKDQQPRWDPPTPPAVDEGAGDPHFAPPAEAERGSASGMLPLK